MVRLGEHLALHKTRTDSLGAIKNLNLWGNELDDVSLVGRMPNMEVCSLSVNNISTLRHFRDCPRLRELYLRKNAVASLWELKHLQSLPGLQLLWLSENPVASAQQYRETVIQMLPQLTKLDNREIDDDERRAANLVPVAKEMLPGAHLSDEEVARLAGGGVLQGGGPQSSSPVPGVRDVRSSTSSSGSASSNANNNASAPSSHRHHVPQPVRERDRPASAAGAEFEAGGVDGIAGGALGAGLDPAAGDDAAGRSSSHGSGSRRHSHSRSHSHSHGHHHGHHHHQNHGPDGSDLPHGHGHGHGSHGHGHGGHHSRGGGGSHHHSGHHGGHRHRNSAGESGSTTYSSSGRVHADKAPVLYAVVSLLNVLDEDALRTVRSEIDVRLAR